MSGTWPPRQSPGSLGHQATWGTFQDLLLSRPRGAYPVHLTTCSPPSHRRAAKVEDSILRLGRPFNTASKPRAHLPEARGFITSAGGGDAVDPKCPAH